MRSCACSRSLLFLLDSWRVGSLPCCGLIRMSHDLYATCCILAIIAFSNQVLQLESIVFVVRIVLVSIHNDRKHCMIA